MQGTAVFDVVLCRFMLAASPAQRERSAASVMARLVRDVMAGEHIAAGADVAANHGGIVVLTRSMKNEGAVFVDRAFDAVGFLVVASDVDQQDSGQRAGLALGRDRQFELGGLVARV